MLYLFKSKNVPCNLFFFKVESNSEDVGIESKTNISLKKHFELLHIFQSLNVRLLVCRGVLRFTHFLCLAPFQLIQKLTVF